jgi:uncharacterized glyoxalase superfamily protein PhnB
VGCSRSRHEQQPEFEAVVAQAQSAGTCILKAIPTSVWGGYSGDFADPDGYLWEVAWKLGLDLAD